MSAQDCLHRPRGLRRSVRYAYAPRSAAPFGVSFAVLKIWENVETRASAQTTTFPDPNFSALQARRPDWGATPRPALRREYWFSWFICCEARWAYSEAYFLSVLGH